MSHIPTCIRATGLAFAAVALIAASGCNKNDDAAPESAASTPAVTSPDLFSKPMGEAMPDPTTVLAVVNGTEITLAEFNKEMDVMLSRMRGRVPPERLGQMRMQMRDQLLDNMITRQLLNEAVAAESITISEDEFNAAVTELTESLPPGMTLEDMLAQTGTSDEEFRTTLTSELEIRKLIESHVGEPTPPTDEELQAFYDENQEQFQQPETVTASHILIGTTPEDTEEDKAAKRKQLEDIRQQLVDGGDFAALASEHSSCPSKAQGGNLGTFPRGRMVPAFEEAAFSQEVGSVGDIVETQFGYHLIQVSEREEAGLTPLEDVKEQLSQYLAGQSQQKVVQDYITALREKAEVTFPEAAAN